MKFSVIIPLYNKRDFVLQAVESVISQRYDDFELLVINDGSTDGSAELLEARVSDPRLRIIWQENMGGAGGQARNTGMAEAKGEWFAFLDADDIWLPNHLDELDAIAHHIGKPALISSRPIELPIGSMAQVDLRPNRTICELNYFQEAGHQIGQNNCSSSAIHREVFENVGGYAFHPAGDDLEYWARVALEYPYAASDRATSIYYRGTLGVMEQIASETKDAPPRRLSTLEAVSPSLAMLADRARQDPTLFDRSDIRAYVNGRLRSGIRISIRRSMPEAARALRRLMIGPVDRQTWILALASRLPQPMLRLLNTMYDVYAHRRNSE